MSFEARLQVLLDEQAADIKEEIARVRRAADDLVAEFERQINVLKHRTERGPTVEETLASMPVCPDCNQHRTPEHVCPAKPIFKGNRENARNFPPPTTGLLHPEVAKRLADAGLSADDTVGPALPPEAQKIIDGMLGRQDFDSDAIKANMSVR